MVGMRSLDHLPRFYKPDWGDCREIGSPIGGRPGEWALIWDEGEKALLPHNANSAAVQPVRAFL
jgi:hypothetical protein